MIITVTLNPAVDKLYWVKHLKICDLSDEQFLTRAFRSSTSAGGKGVNMSIFLSQLGMENVAMGFVGGYTGHVVVRDLRDKGVTTNFVWTDGETRTNVAVFEEGREHIPMFIDEAGPTIAESEAERFLRRYRRMLHRSSWVVLAGSLPPGIDVGFYRELATMARDAGCKVILSTGGEALVEGMKACPYLVKPDTRESGELMGIRLDSREAVIEAGKRIVSCGVGHAIISHKIKGDIVVSGDAAWEIKTPVPAAELKNLVGADDVFLAGILYKLASDAPVEEAYNFGLAAGMASAERDEKICADLESIRIEQEKITVQRIEGEAR